MIIVQVAFPLPIRTAFEYIMPDFMNPVLGGRIVVPFRSKEIIGIVISFYKTNKKQKINLKYVKKLIDTHSLYTSVLLKILIWIKNNYHCFVNLFFSILPRYFLKNYNLKSKYIYKWSVTKKGLEINLNNYKNSKKKLRALSVLKKNNVLNFELKKYSLSKATLKKLEIQGLCKLNLFYEPYFYQQNHLNIKKKFF